MIKIHDIKPLVDIPDNSIYFYYGLICFSILLCLLILYFIYTFLTNNKISKQKEYFQILQNLDFHNPKQTAYTISKYGYLLDKDEQEQRLFEDLNNSLEEFKYKKNISKTIPSNIKAKYDIFMDRLNVQ